MPTLERSELKALVDRMDALPTLSGVAAQLLQLTNDDTTDSATIARVIESDQALTARLLRLVNSTAFNFPAEIKTVSRAVVTLGFKTIRCIALGMAVTHLFPRQQGGHAFHPQEFWKHSLACAVCAELLASRLPGRVDKDEAFVAGLLHDIGKLVISTCMRKEYDAVVDRARKDDIPLLDAEHEMLGVDHCEAGKWLAERWGLPDVFAQVIWLHHHAPGSVTLNGASPTLIAVVRLADALVRGQMIGSGGNDHYAPLTSEYARELGLSDAVLADVKSVLCKRVEERAAVIDIELEESELYLESLQKANLGLSRMSLKAEEHNRRLERRVRRFRALHEMNALLGPNQTLNDVLGILARSLRDGFEVKTGLCYVANGRKASIRGKAWRDGGRLRDFDLAFEENGKTLTGDAQGIDAAMYALLREFSVQFKGDLGAVQGNKDILRRHDLLVAPMTAEGRSVGQIMIDMRSAEARFDLDLAVDEILAFAAAGGMAVSRVYVNETLKRRSEELATAMLKKEQAHKQLLHSERLAAVGKMAAGAAHEINNPLAIISGRAQMMMQKERDPADEKALKLIVDQCSRASKILTDLMSFARPALPKKELVNINAVVFEGLWMFESRYESRGITLHREFAESLPNVLVDGNQMQQVFVNLLMNAEHAVTPPGSVTVRSGLTETGDKVFVSFADTGCGIPPENLQHIFEPFFTTKEAGQGTGLGLALAYSIVKSHQGTITVKSRAGHGTTFTISLPAAGDVAAVMERGERGSARAELKESKRVLVVDDETHVRAVLVEALTGAGYNVEQADTGIAALRSIQHGAFDLVTLDIRMPSMDGMAVLRAMRERLPQFPVIVITGLASAEEIDAAKSLGVYSCIRKPFEVSQVIAEVRRALAERS